MLQRLVRSNVLFKSIESWYLVNDSQKRMSGLQELYDFFKHKSNAHKINECIP